MDPHSDQPVRSAGFSGAPVAFSVWRALLIRESLARLFGSRAAWFWLLLEPVFHIAYLTFVFTVIKVRLVGGMDTAVWLIVGLLGYFLFQRTGLQTMMAIQSNRPLFVFRQIKPVDTVLSRAVVEGLLAIAVATVLCTGAEIYDVDMIPDDPLGVIEACFGLWFLGLGYGLMASVSVVLVPELGPVLKMFMAPLYLFSGVIFPITAIPHGFQWVLKLNPLLHGLEALRLSFASHYYAIDSLQLPYLHFFALAMVVCGLCLQIGFARRMVAQ